MVSRKRTHKMEKLARIYDAEVLPVWANRFGRMLLRGLEIEPGSQILDVACGTGFPAVEILRRMGEGSRLIAIDGSSAMLDVARKKVEKLGIKGVFFRTEHATPKLSFADDVYDLVVCNLGLDELDDPGRAITDFARVTRPGGEVRCTMPLHGTFEEFYDIYREVLIKHDKHEALARLDDHIANYPTSSDCLAWLDNAGLSDTRVDVEEFSMLFKSSREFFFAPVIEYGPLPHWKRLAGQGQEMQDVFWYIKEAIDAYFLGRAFQITVKAGCLCGSKRDIDDDDVTGRLERIEPPSAREEAMAVVASVSPPVSPALSAEVTPSGVTPSALAETSSPRVTEGTAELDLAELEVIADVEFGGNEAGDDELDAFVEGRPRPRHLVPPMGESDDAAADDAAADND